MIVQEMYEPGYMSVWVVDHEHIMSNKTAIMKDIAWEKTSNIYFLIVKLCVLENNTILKSKWNQWQLVLIICQIKPLTVTWTTGTQ